MDAGSAGASLGVSGGFYVLFGLWWLLQVTKKYWNAKSQRIAFSSTLTYPCCKSFSKFSVEGCIKVISGVTICAVCVLDLAQSPESAETHNIAVGQLTVFIVFCGSGVCDILIQSCERFIFPNLDYMVLVFCFNLQSIVLAYHTEDSISWTAVADTYAMITATTIAITILLELKFPGSLWCSLVRVYCTLVLGTWFIHMVLYNTCKTSVITPNLILNNTDQNFNVTTSINLPVTKVDLRVDSMILYEAAWVPLYFSWHCLSNMIVMTMLWLVTYKCVSHGKCMCIPGEDDRISHFENRVHFDYHVISRMTDSDFEQD